MPEPTQATEVVFRRRDGSTAGWVEQSGTYRNLVMEARAVTPGADVIVMDDPVDDAAEAVEEHLDGDD